MSTSKDISPKIIAKENSSGFESWDLPNVNRNEDNSEEQASLITANELEQIHQQAYSEGYEEGKLRGMKDGFEQGEEEGKKQGHQRAFDASLKEIQQQTFHFEQLFKSIETPFSLSNEQVEYELMNLACSIAKIIIRRELKTEPDLVISLVKNSLALLPSASKNIKIYLNPLDVSMVKKAFSNSEEIHFEAYKILESKNLKRGGCIIDTNISHIDASLDKRIEELAKNIIPNHKKLNNAEIDNSSETSDDPIDLMETESAESEMTHNQVTE
jgi:flagellar assembly protein FliH